MIHNIQRILVLIDNSAEMERVAPCFADLPFGWKVQFVGSRDEALSQFVQVDYDMVFVDLAAGPFASAELLNDLHVIHPRPSRFLLGATFNPDLMVACAVGAHQFLQKPLDVASVRAAIERAGQMDRMLRNKRTQTLLSKLRNFPARPTIYVQLLKELRSPNASASSVGEIVAGDLAISTKLVQLINSAPFGLKRQVTTAHDAVLLLGMETTTSLVLSMEAFSRLDYVKPVFFSIDQLWRHSQIVAQNARKIAERFSNDPAVAHDAFTAGLLHDLGKLALSLNLPQEYRDALGGARERNLPMHEVEVEVLGATHAEAGAYLLAMWGLPGTIVEAVAQHHRPARVIPGDFSALAAVHLANNLESAKNSIRSGFPEFRLDLAYSERLGFQENWDAIREIVGFPKDSGATEIFEASRKSSAPSPAATEEHSIPSTRFLKRFFGGASSN